MTPVYSGGLVYEYSEESSGYGLVKINGNSVSEKSDFAALQSQLAKYKASGDGGYKTNGQASQCPATSDTWQVKDFTGSQLPAIPAGAVKYMQSGAGKGPGLTGDGSQNAGGASTGTASPGSGSVTATASASKGAASGLLIQDLGFAPFVCTGAVMVCALFGAMLI